MGPATLERCRKPPALTQMFVMERGAGEKDGAAIATDESVCLDAPEKDDKNRTPRVRVIACSGFPRQTWLRDVKVSVRFYQNISMLRLYSTIKCVSRCCIKLYV